MAAAAILDFWQLEILLVIGVERVSVNWLTQTIYQIFMDNMSDVQFKVPVTEITSQLIDIAETIWTFNNFNQHYSWLHTYNNCHDHWLFTLLTTSYQHVTNNWHNQLLNHTSYAKEITPHVLPYTTCTKTRPNTHVLSCYHHIPPPSL